MKNAAWQRFQKEFERDFYTKIIVTVIPITNSMLSSNYTQIINKFDFNFVCLFVKTKKQELNFHEVGDLVTRNVSFLAYSKSRSTSKKCGIQWTFVKGFSYMLFLRVL